MILGPLRMKPQPVTYLSLCLMGAVLAVYAWCRVVWPGLSAFPLVPGYVVLYVQLKRYGWQKVKTGPC